MTSSRTHFPTLSHLTGTIKFSCKRQKTHLARGQRLARPKAVHRGVTSRGVMLWLVANALPHKRQVTLGGVKLLPHTGHSDADTLR